MVVRIELPPYFGFFFFFGFYILVVHYFLVILSSFGVTLRWWVSIRGSFCNFAVLNGELGILNLIKYKNSVGGIGEM